MLAATLLGPREHESLHERPIGPLLEVVAHELVHLRHRDHTKAFWARLGAAMPDYERRKDELRRLGPRLQWG